MSETEKVLQAERLRSYKAYDELLAESVRIVTELEAEVAFKRKYIRNLEVEVVGIEAERDAAINLLRSCFVRLPTGNLKLRRTIQAFLDNADTGFVRGTFPNKNLGENPAEG